MEEANKIIEETLENTGFEEVTEMLPENPGVGKKLAIAGGIGFLAGLVVSKAVKPAVSFVKSKLRKKAISNDDFEVVEDDDFFEDEAETEKTE